MKKFRFLLPAVLTVITASVQAEWHQFQQNIMGTRIHVELWHESESTAHYCSEQVFSEMHRIDGLMSVYKPDSEVSLINQSATQAAQALSSELTELIEKSLQYSDHTNGAFDITYASVGYKYNYRKKQRPSNAFIDEYLDSIDYRAIELKNGSIYFSKKGMRIDLGGIAKGYAVDQGLEILEKCGVSQALVSAGGDSRLLGDRQGRPWMMGIQHPRNRRAVALRIPLSSTAISTSGDYERFFFIKDERIHHIINPETGASAKGVWSATVIGPEAIDTDALSTSIFILGVEKGIQLIDTLPEFEAVMIDSNAKVHYSSGLGEPEQADIANN